MTIELTHSLGIELKNSLYMPFDPRIIGILIGECTTHTCLRNPWTTTVIYHYRYYHLHTTTSTKSLSALPLKSATNNKKRGLGSYFMAEEIGEKIKLVIGFEPA